MTMSWGLFKTAGDSEWRTNHIRAGRAVRRWYAAAKELGPKRRPQTLGQVNRAR